MKKKLREILSKYRQNEGYTMEHAERELLDLFSVSHQRELLIALLRETDLEYIQHQDCPEILAENIIKAIYSI